VLTRGRFRQPSSCRLYRVSGSTFTAVGCSWLLARWPGTHSIPDFFYPSGIQRAAQTVLGVYVKRTCPRVTSASIELGVVNDYALYRSTHSLTRRNRGSGASPTTPSVFDGQFLLGCYLVRLVTVCCFCWSYFRRHSYGVTRERQVTLFAYPTLLWLTELTRLQ